MTHNASVHYEDLSVSRSMTPCKGKRQIPIEFERKRNESLNDLLSRHENSFLEYASNQAISLKSQQIIGTDRHQSMEALTVPIQCYAVEFNDEFVTISLIK